MRSVRAQGLRGNLEVTLVYMEAWLRGVGCVPIDNLMEVRGRELGGAPGSLIAMELSVKK